MINRLECRILGSLEVVSGDRLVHVGGRRSQITLAMLLLEAGCVVPTTRLIEAVWAGRPPESARTQIAMGVSQLRRVLRERADGHHVIETGGSGYRIPKKMVELDAWTAERSLLQARKTVLEGRADEALVLFRDALALWRGPVLAGLDSLIIAAEVRRLEDLRLSAIEELGEVELTLGRHRELITKLPALVARNPFRERLRAHLMTALARSGLQADALAVYQEGRRVLAEELGLEPGRRLRDLHEAILRDDPCLHEPDARAAARARPQILPAQLPATIRDFTGRVAELGRLDELMDLEDRTGRHPRICVINGVAGVGKSSLALHWAHSVSARFEHGQLFADLRGHAVNGQPVPPEVVLERFLHALGTPPRWIPEDLEARAALYRSTLRERRILIVLDGAVSAAQVRPLLPGAGGCHVLVTARDRLEELMIDHGSPHLTLQAFSEEEALTLLERAGRPVRTEEDRAAARRLADLCDGLPLALRIAAIRLASRPALTMADLAQWLTDTLAEAPRSRTSWRIAALPGVEPEEAEPG